MTRKKSVDGCHIPFSLFSFSFSFPSFSTSEEGTNTGTHTGLMHLHIRDKLENHIQRRKHTTQPSQIGHVAQSQLNSTTPRSLSATRGIAHKIDIPRLGPTKTGCLDSLSFIAILKKVMDLGSRDKYSQTHKHSESEKAP